MVEMAGVNHAVTVLRYALHVASLDQVHQTCACLVHEHKPLT